MVGLYRYFTSDPGHGIFSVVDDVSSYLNDRILESSYKYKENLSLEKLCIQTHAADTDLVVENQVTLESDYNSSKERTKRILKAKKKMASAPVETPEQARIRKLEATNQKLQNRLKHARTLVTSERKSKSPTANAKDFIEVTRAGLAASRATSRKKVELVGTSNIKAQEAYANKIIRDSDGEARRNDGNRDYTRIMRNANVSLNPKSSFFSV